MKSYHCKSKSKSPKHDCNYHFETRELLLEMESPELMEANALQCHISASHIHSQRKTVLTSTASWWVPAGLNAGLIHLALKHRHEFWLNKVHSAFM